MDTATIDQLNDCSHSLRKGLASHESESKYAAGLCTDYFPFRNKERMTSTKGEHLLLLNGH